METVSKLQYSYRDDGVKPGNPAVTTRVWEALRCHYIQQRNIHCMKHHHSCNFYTSVSVEINKDDRTC